jgi:small multidrug resistance family-3 protein
VTALRAITLFIWLASPDRRSLARVARRVRRPRARFVAGGFVALAIYGLIATGQPDSNFGRVLAAYGGIFIAGSFAWGMAVDGFRPHRYDFKGPQLL